MTEYLALIGDLKKSRLIAGRADAQQEIKQALSDINAAYPQLFASRLTLTLGDEFQALLYPEQAGFMQMLDDLEARLIRYPFRLGLGLGSISTAIDRNISIGADGEAYWNARAAIDYVHANHAGGKVNTQLISPQPDRDCLLNALLESADLIKHGWTALQQETLHRMMEQGIYADSFDQKAFASAIGISQSSLTKRLSAGNIKFYIKLRLIIEQSIQREARHAE